MKRIGKRTRLTKKKRFGWCMSYDVVALEILCDSQNALVVVTSLAVVAPVMRLGKELGIRR